MSINTQQQEAVLNQEQLVTPNLRNPEHSYLKEVWDYLDKLSFGMQKNLENRLHLLESSQVTFQSRLSSEFLNIQQSYRMDNQKVEQFEAKLDQINEKLSKQKKYVRKFDSYFKRQDQIQVEMYSKINDNKKSAGKCIKDIEQLRETLEMKCNWSDIQNISDMIKEQQKGLKNKQEELMESIEQLKEYNKATYLSQEQYKNDAAALWSQICQNFYTLDDGKSHKKQIESLQNRVNLNKAKIKGNKQSAESIWKYFEQKPWTQDVQEISTQMQDKIDSKTFEQFRQKNQKTLNKINIYFSNFTSQQKIFQSAQERFDEILLSKVNKPDLDNLVQEYQKFKSFVIQLLDTNKAQINKNNEQLFFSQNLLEDLQKQLKSVKFYMQSLKQEGHDFKIIYEQLSELEQLTKSKANKSDLISALNAFSSQDETEQLSSILQTMKNQLETTVILLITSLRTMIKSSESQLSRNRRRLEIQHQTQKLLSWIQDANNSDDSQLVKDVQKILFNPSRLKQREMTPSPTEAFQSPKLHEIPKFIRIKSRNKTSHLERDLPPLKKEIEKQLYTN